MKYPWLYVGCKVVCIKRGLWRNAWNGRVYWRWWREPRRKCVYTVTAFRTNALGNYVRLSGFGDASYDASHFRPVLPNTTKQVEALKKAMRDHVNAASGGMGVKVRA